MKDIIDLDYLLGLDENPPNDQDKDGDADPTRLRGPDPDRISERDRDIFAQVDRPGLDDPSLLMAWLDYRRLLFFHESGENGILPGTLFASLYGWTIRGLMFLGLVLGLVTAFSFLAYHGSRPVNVTLFIAFFIFFPALLAAGAGWVMARRIRGGGAGGSFFQTLVFHVFMKQFHQVLKKASSLPGGGLLASMTRAGAKIRFKTRAYQGVFFWYFFIASSLTGLCFSLGALGGTLFRVMVTDLAFGWQSTFFTSGAQIHTLVSWLALPWSWIMPDWLPGPEQIEGSRIILKEGIASLSAENLTAWWPFLAMGILVYGVLPRVGVVAGAVLARNRALAGFDFEQPRYRRLLMRMRTPRMDTQIRKTGGTKARNRAPLPDPQKAVRPGPPAAPIKPAGPDHGEIKEPAQERPVPEPCPPAGDLPAETPDALVLASARAYPGPAMAGVVSALDRQLGISSALTHDIFFDFNRDRESLAALARGKGPVIVVQEVWQPPIRGLLYYLVQLKQEIFFDRPLWIFLTQTPDELDTGVDAGDVNYQVWKTALAQLNDPGIILERWVA